MDFYKHEKNFIIYIFYGSEKGFSKSIAEHLSIKMKENKVYGIKIDIMNNFFNYKLNKGDITFFITSTCALGDFPSNAKSFVKYLVDTKINNLEYTVLAIGDSTYEEYCNAGKRLDTLLKKAGGKDFKSITLFDESIHDNEEIEVWFEDCSNYVSEYKKKLYNWFIKSMSSP